MKKVFEVSTKSENGISNLTWFVFAEEVKEAITKVQNVLSNEEHIFKVYFLCTVDEDIDLEQYKTERLDEVKE
jgi:hypothetical protein